ncbi:MAG: hypothetical protein ACO32I_07270, partial [Candidatus Limnocylindrus sp.]
AINPQLSAMVWKLGDGEVSGVESLGDQLAIIRVNAIENKPYTEEQRRTVEASGFDIWLDGFRSTAKITIDGAVVQEAGESRDGAERRWLTRRTSCGGTSVSTTHRS